jgi:hypothetical protein
VVIFRFIFGRCSDRIPDGRPSVLLVLSRISESCPIHYPPIIVSFDDMQSETTVVKQITK